MWPPYSQPSEIECFQDPTPWTSHLLLYGGRKGRSLGYPRVLEDNVRASLPQLDNYRASSEPQPMELNAQEVPQQRICPGDSSGQKVPTECCARLWRAEGWCPHLPHAWGLLASCPHNH